LSEDNINKLSVETKFNQRSNGVISGYEILMLLINSGFGEEKLSLDNFNKLPDGYGEDACLISSKII